MRRTFSERRFSPIRPARACPGRECRRLRGGFFATSYRFGRYRALVDVPARLQLFDQALEVLLVGVIGSLGEGELRLGRRLLLVAESRVAAHQPDVNGPLVGETLRVELEH